MFTEEIKRSRSKRPLVIGLVVVAVVAAVVLLVPMPRTLKTRFVLAPGSSTELTAPRDGVIAEIVTNDGATVARGSVIAKYDVTDLDKQIAELEKKLASLEEQKSKPPNAKARAALVKAQAALKAAEVALEKATKANKSKAEKKRDAAKTVVEKATAAVGPGPEALETELTSSREALTALQAQLASATITSPASGVLTLVGLEKGVTLKASAKLGTVDDVSKLRAQVDVPTGETVGKGQAAVLVLPGGNKRVMFDGEVKGSVAEALFENARGELKAGTRGDAELDGTQRSLVAR